MPFMKYNQCKANRPISQIPECTCPISYNAQFRSEMCIFLSCSQWSIVGYEISAFPNHFVPFVRRNRIVMTHFIDNLSVFIQIRWKFRFVVIQFVKWPLLHCARVRSLHVYSFAVIKFSGKELRQISITVHQALSKWFVIIALTSS